MMTSGSWGKLVSTIPFVTSTAWTTFMTGMNPGRHGVAGFFARDSANPTDTGSLVSGMSVKNPTLWRYLSEGGIRVGVFGVPMTYRPETVNGFMISGFPLPHDSKDYTYPLALRAELEEKGWNFADVPTQSYSKNRLDPFYDELKARAAQKTDAVIHLLSTRPEIDFFMVHYFETDKLLHEFLNFRYPGKCSARDYAHYHGYVDDFMLYLDGLLGRVLAALPASCGVLVVSDHGLAPGNHLFMPDTWLLNKGYIRVSRRLSSRFRHIVFRLGITPELGFKVAPGRVSGLMLKSFMSEYWEAKTEEEKSPRKKPLASRALYALLLDKRRDIDWESSVAYSFGGYGVASIYLRSGVSQERHDEARREIHEALSQVKDGKERVLDKVYYDQEVYVWEGDRHDLPDIVAYNEKSEYVAMSNPAYLTSNKVTTRKYSNKNEANHDRNGIFIASGIDFATQGEFDPIDIADIFPTVLHFFGLGVPSNVDGRVAMGLFKRGTKPAETPPRAVAPLRAEGEAGAFSRSEEAEITSRLKDMGYI